MDTLNLPRHTSAAILVKTSFCSGEDPLLLGAADTRAGPQSERICLSILGLVPTAL